MNCIVVNQELKELFQNYLKNSDERNKYLRQVKGYRNSQGKPIDPWDRIYFLDYVQSCLNDINKILRSFTSKKLDFSVATLVDAHHIDHLCLGIILGEKITSKKITKESAKALHDSYNILSSQLDAYARRIKYSSEGSIDISNIQKLLSEFSDKWNDFESHLRDDKFLAKKYEKVS